jgi:arsenite-transporting ATPase
VSNRLVLLSGTPRAGTSTLAAAAIQAADRAGYESVLVQSDRIDAHDLRRAAWPQVTDALSVLAPHLSLLGRDSEDFITLPGIDELLLLREMASRITVAADVVVVDAGQVDRLIALVNWLEAVSDLVEEVPSVRVELGRIRSALFDAQATVRIVTTPDDVLDAAAAVAGLSLAGFHIDGVIINKVPKKDDGWPKAWAKQQRARARVGAKSLGDLPVATVPLREGRIKVSLARHFGLDTAWTPAPLATVEADGDGYRWSIPLIDPRQQPIEVGYRGDAVFIHVGEYRRRVQMPSVVQRCVIVAAEVGPNAIDLICQPNPEVWPR